MDAAQETLILKDSEVVTQATEQILQMACGVEIQPLDAVPPEAEDGSMIVALISIVGDVDWAVFLGLPPETAEAIAQKFAGFEIPFDSPDMGDAVGELTNIFAGQVKALLDGRGVKADISLPSVMRAKGIQLLVQRGGASRKTCFESPLGLFWTGVVAGSE